MRASLRLPAMNNACAISDAELQVMFVRKGFRVGLPLFKGDTKACSVTGLVDRSGH